MRRHLHDFLFITGAGLLLVVFLATLPFWLVRWPAAVDRALDASGLARAVGGNGGTQRVRVDRVVRFAPTDLRLKGVRFESLTPAGWEPWARVGTVELAWRPQSFLARRIYVSRMAVDSVGIDLRKRPASIESGSASPAAKPAQSDPWSIADRLPPIRIPELKVANVELIDPQGRLRAASLEISGFALRRGRVEATVRRAHVSAVPESLWVTLTDGLIDAQIPQSVVVTALGLEGPGLRARLDGSWTAPAVAPGGAGRTAPGPGQVSVQMEVRELRPTRVPPIRSLGLPWHPTDALTGRIDARGFLGGGMPPRAECDVDLAGSVFGTNLDTLLAAGRASIDTADVREVHLRLGTIGVRGSTRWVRAGTSRADLRFRGIDLGSPPISLFADGMPVSDFAGTVRAEADSLGPRIRLRAELDLEPGSLLNRPTSGVSIRARFDPQALVVEELRTREDPPALALDGVWRRTERTVAAQGMLLGFRLEDWVAPWLHFPLEGEVHGPFRIEGPLTSPAVQASLTADAGRVEDVFLGHVRFDSIAGTVVPLRLRTGFHAEEVDAYKVPFDSVAGAVWLADTIRTGLRAWRDTLRVDLAARVVPRTRGTVLFDSLTARIGRLPSIELTNRSRLDWSPELVRIDSLQLRMAEGRAGGNGWIRPRPGHGGTEPFAFAAEVADFDLGSLVGYLGLSTDDWSGFATGRLEGEGTLRSPVYRFHLEATGVETADWSWSRVEAAGRAGEGIGLRVDSLRASSRGFIGPLPGPEPVGPQPPGPEVLVRADSLFAQFALPWAEALEALSDSVRRGPVLARTKVGGAVAVQRVPAAPFLIPVLGARAWDDGGTGLDESADPMLEVIRVVRPAADSNGPARGNTLAGRFDLAAEFGGTLRSPEARLDLVARDLRMLQAGADSVRLRGGYADSLITLERLEWHMGQSLLEARGSLPRDIDLSAPAVRSLERPGQARVDLKDADLSLISLLPDVGGVAQDPSGRLNGWVELGPPAGPGMLAGHLEIADGAFRIAKREEKLRDVRAVARLDSAGVHIEEAVGSLGSEGRVTASGLFRALDRFDVRATVRDGLAYETGNYRFLFEGDFAVQPIAEGDSTRPRLTGNVRVLEGLITQDLAKPPPAGSVPPRTPWLIDVDAVAPGNFRVNQPMATVELGEGELHIAFRWPYWNLGGSVEVLSGRYRIFNRSLNITSGTIEFQDIGQGPNPYFDIQAETEMAGQGDEPPIQVVVTVKGYPAKQELSVTLSSPDHPEYSEAQLIELLSVGQLTSGSFGSFTRDDPTRQALSSELMGQVERQLVGQLPWIDRVQLEGQLLGSSPMRINLRPIVQPQWSLIYSQDLAASPDREVAVRYRLSNLFFLNAAVDRRNNEQGLPTDTYSLDLKLRFEY